MLILKYFLVVGAVLTAGLIALSAYLGPPPPAGIRAASSSSLPTVAPKVESANTEPTAQPLPPPAQSVAPARRANRSTRAHRRSQ